MKETEEEEDKMDDLFAVTVERNQTKKNKQNTSVSSPNTSVNISRAKTPPLPPKSATKQRFIYLFHSFMLTLL